MLSLLFGVKMNICSQIKRDCEKELIYIVEFSGFSCLLVSHGGITGK